MEAAYDFPVQLKPVTLLGSDVPIPGHKAIVRTDTHKPLSIVTDKYHLFTNRQAVDLTTNFLKGFGEHQAVDTIEKDGLRFIRTCTFQNHSLKVAERKVGDIVNFQLSIWNSYDRKSSFRLRIGARVLKCLNGMTVPGGSLDLSFRHTDKGIQTIELPEPDKVLGIFTQAREQWNDWASERLSSQQRDAILHHAMEGHVIGERLLDKHRSLLEPDVNPEITFWQYFNSFTNIITHHLPKVQLTAKIVRLDRLNDIFRNVLHGKAQPGFTDEENE
jgi:hypothetical protein